MLKKMAKQLSFIMKQRKALRADNFKLGYELIGELMVGNIDAVKGHYDVSLASFGIEMNKVTQDSCVDIAKLLVESMMNMRLIVAADLQAYVAERVRSTQEHGAVSAAADGDEHVLFSLHEKP